jgi:hypothetical protein
MTWCGTGSVAGGGAGAPPAGLQSSEIKLSGSSGSRAGYYCEGYDSYTSQGLPGPGRQDSLSIRILWTDATRPVFGILVVYVQIPPDATTTDNDSLLAAARAYWNTFA